LTEAYDVFQMLHGQPNSRDQFRVSISIFYHEELPLQPAQCAYTPGMPIWPETVIFRLNDSQPELLRLEGKFFLLTANAMKMELNGLWMPTFPGW